MRNRLVSIIFSFAVLALAVSCENSFLDTFSHSKTDGSNVTIRLAGSSGRTIMPVEPVFNRYELVLTKEGGIPTIEDAYGIDVDGVTVTLSEGTWTISVIAYQDIFNDGIGVPAAQGSASLKVVADKDFYDVPITLQPVAMGSTAEKGLFSFNVIFPQDVNTAVLSIKDGAGNKAAEDFDLLISNVGLLSLSQGCYDISIILTRDGQYAGLFESVHIYSGLESPAVLDMSTASFAEKVYLAGKLGGIRIGTIKIANDEAGTDVIKEIELERNTAKRDDFWIIDIPANNIGETVYAVLEFNGEKTTKTIPTLESNGRSDINLGLIPSSVKYINIAPWYSEVTGGNNPELTVDGDAETAPQDASNLVLDFGFDTTVNFIRVVYGNSESGFEYIVQYFQNAMHQSSFEIKVKDNLPISEFELYNAADRAALTAAIETAQNSYTSFKWRTTAEYAALNAAINDAQDAFNNPILTEEQITYATAVLNTAITVFNAERTVLTLSPGYSYSTLTAVWTPAHMADAYRVIYNYEGGDWITPEDGWKSADEFERDADGNFRFTFKPRGYNEIANSGKTLYVRVLAINSTTGEYIFSNDTVKRLVGPAIINIETSQMKSADYIDVSWDAIEGANGYYVSRRPFNMSNTGATGAAVMYYVSANGAVTGNDTATASVSGSRFTLLDSTEADYSGAISGYLHRYIVIPVMNVSDVPVVDYDNNSYTLQENDEDITLTGIPIIEKIGHSTGFAENVTATKGTYASSGNINDRIRITWSKPARFADAGLQYFVYRRPYNGNWELVEGPTGAFERIETPSRGIMYEYAVSVGYVLTGNTPTYTPSLPQNSPRYVEWERTKKNNKDIPKFQGFIQDVKMHSVSRGEDAEVNAVLGERVTWHTPLDHNKAIDGYTVYLMNRNINANWHVIAGETDSPQIPSVPAQYTGATQSLLLTPSNTRSVNNTVNVSRNLLFVLRDYKHFYKVRSYVLNDAGTRIYSHDPAWTYEYRWGTTQATHIAASEQMQNDYVKWGARQINDTEFVKIATLYVSRGFERYGTGWPITGGTKTYNASTNMGGSGSWQIAYSGAGPVTWTFTFNNYKDDLQTRVNDWVTFVTISGATRANAATGSAYPRRYRAYDDNTWLYVIGPWDTPHLYNGQIQIGYGSDNASTNLFWDSGQVKIVHPSGTSARNISFKGSDTPLAFTTRGDNRLNGNDWR